MKNAEIIGGGIYFFIMRSSFCLGFELVLEGL
jgi:hypothetical protein